MDQIQSYHNLTAPKHPSNTISQQTNIDFKITARDRKNCKRKKGHRLKRYEKMKKTFSERRNTLQVRNERSNLGGKRSDVI